MINWFRFLIIIVLLTSCDDGDIIQVQLDFDKNLDLCEIETTDQNSNTISKFIFYDTKTNPNQSLSLVIPNSPANQTMFNPISSGFSQNISIDGNSTLFNYRSYNGNPSDIICSIIQPGNIIITEDYESSSGNANFLSTFVDDDNDGVPSNLEENLDTDNDGIPNYIDNDDDGDNILTINENPDPNNDGDLSDAQDTDGDSIPDYLDNDDDDDGTLTINEDENANGNLFDDIANGSSIPRFLDQNFSNFYSTIIINQNQYFRTVTITITLTNINISILSADTFSLGTYENIIVL